MKVGQEYFNDKSSFLAMEKDFALITHKLLNNQRLVKLLYYTQPDALKGPDLTAEQIRSLIHKQIRIVPKLDIDQHCPNFIVISFDNFVPNAKKKKIVGEIDAMMNNAKLSGIGELNFVTCNDLILNDQLMGLTLIYRAINGVEDRIDPLVK